LRVSDNLFPLYTAAAFSALVIFLGHAEIDAYIYSISALAVISKFFICVFHYNTSKEGSFAALLLISAISGNTISHV
jgi:hypothetical protein